MLMRKVHANVLKRDVWVQRLDRLHPTAAKVEEKYTRKYINIVMNAPREAQLMSVNIQ
jgi:hypothetical protein